MTKPRMNPVVVATAAGVGITASLALFGKGGESPEIIANLTEIGRYHYRPEREIAIYIIGCILSVGLCVLLGDWDWDGERLGERIGERDGLHDLDAGVTGYRGYRQHPWGGLPTLKLVQRSGLRLQPGIPIPDQDRKLHGLHVSLAEALQLGGDLHWDRNGDRNGHGHWDRNGDRFRFWHRMHFARQGCLCP